MPDRFSTAISRGLARLSEAAGVAATYSRGATSLAITVVWGRSEVMEVNDQMAATVIDMSDAIVADYAGLVAQFTEPQAGDLIIHNGITRRVLPGGSVGHVFRWMGNSRQALRIHTKVIDE